MEKKGPVVHCPTCGKPVQWGPNAPWRPFCSERCRLVDLGEWIEERRRIPDPEGTAPGAPPPEEEE